MKHLGVDFILCPAYVGAGVLQGGAEYWNYTAIWNVLDQPAAILPSGLRVDKSMDRPEEGYKPRNPDDEREWRACKSASATHFPRQISYAVSDVY